MNWVSAVSELSRVEVIAIDGKTLRRSADRANGKSALHLVSAWSSANRLVLGQVKVDDRSNEITAIPQLLNMLEVSGCVVTIDAMGCQKKIAKTIVKRGADYALSVKKNQPQLYEDITGTFAQAREADFAGLDFAGPDFFETVEKSHGRIDKRRCWATSTSDCLAYLNDKGQWKKLASIAMVESERTERVETSVESRCYISSLPVNKPPIIRLGTFVLIFYIVHREY